MFGPWVIEHLQLGKPACDDAAGIWYRRVDGKLNKFLTTRYLDVTYNLIPWRYSAENPLQFP